MKYIRYLKDLVKHKYYVIKASYKMGIVWRGLMHDNSKFLPGEFFPYVNNFFGDKNALDVRKAFLYACNDHYKRNKHHWQYWVAFNRNGSTYELVIPEIYIKEMICDWWAFGMARKGKSDMKEYYMENSGLIKIHPDSRKILEYLIVKFEEDQ